MASNDVQLSPRCSRRFGNRRRAFTITEVLVIMGVIALLMGILLPALGAVRTTSRMTVEMSAARQLMVAYSAYANANRGQVLTGYPDGLDFRVYDKAQQPMSGGMLSIAKLRYPWRIAPYLDYEFRALYTNHMRDTLEAMEHDPFYMYKVATFPSLGLNSQWVGGDFSPGGLASADPDSTARKTYGTFWVSSISQPQRPDRLIVFASARGAYSLPGVPDSAAMMTEGYFKIVSPRFSASQGERWAESYHVATQPSDYGYISTRYFGEAVTAFMDGRVDALNADQLRDMRHWADQATHEDWGLTANTNHE